MPINELNFWTPYEQFGIQIKKDVDWRIYFSIQVLEWSTLYLNLTQLGLYFNAYDITETFKF